MPIKWQYFLAGLLAGIILTGVVFLLFTRSDSQVRFAILTGQAVSYTHKTLPTTERV
jgi:uncharacterized membrane-anchored protein YhcB (DUF1043 family)